MLAWVKLSTDATNSTTWVPTWWSSFIIQGWIPTSVVNFSLEAIPLNIQRIRSALQRLPRPVLERLPVSNKDQALRCKTSIPPEALGGHAANRRSAASHAVDAAAASNKHDYSSSCLDDDDVEQTKRLKLY